MVPTDRESATRVTHENMSAGDIAGQFLQDSGQLSRLTAELNIFNADAAVGRTAAQTQPTDSRRSPVNRRRAVSAPASIKAGPRCGGSDYVAAQDHTARLNADGQLPALHTRLSGLFGSECDESWEDEGEDGLEEHELEDCSTDTPSRWRLSGWR